MQHNMPRQKLEAVKHTGSPYAPRVFLASRGFPDCMRIWFAAGMSHRETNVSCRASTLHARFSQIRRSWRLMHGSCDAYCPLGERGPD